MRNCQELLDPGGATEQRAHEHGECDVHTHDVRPTLAVLQPACNTLRWRHEKKKVQPHPQTSLDAKSEPRLCPRATSQQVFLFAFNSNLHRTLPHFTSSPTLILLDNIHRDGGTKVSNNVMTNVDSRLFRGAHVGQHTVWRAKASTATTQNREKTERATAA